MTIFGLPGGTVDGIQIGGFTMGDISLNLYSRSYGMMWITNTPAGVYAEKSTVTEVEEFKSSLSEEHKHRVLFETEKVEIVSDEEDKLRTYVKDAVRNYEQGPR